MNINKKIYDTLKKFNIHIQQDFYVGKEDMYMYYTYDSDVGFQFSDNNTLSDLVSVKIHLIVNNSFNYIDLAKEIREELFNNDFSYPTILVFTENENKKRHIVFETEIETEV